MNKVYLVSAKRSAIGAMLGSLKDLSPTYLGAQVLKAAIAENTASVPILPNTHI